jgi:V/A-type H+-transporting ATPase subunit F
MKLFLISDETDTLMGMRLAGVEGVQAKTKEEAEAEIRKAVADPEIGILMITTPLTELCRDLVVDRKLNYKRPLLIEVPDRGGSGGLVTALERYVSEAVGIKI